MKKIFLVIFLMGLFLPLISLADGAYSVTNADTGAIYNFEYEGLVPCGRCLKMIAGGMPMQIVVGLNNPIDCQKNGYFWIGGACRMCPANKRYVNCTICHIFVMIDGIVDFILLKIIPPLATLMLMIGGLALYTAGSSPERFNKAKSILFSAIIGLVIAYTSWIIISTVLSAVGVASWVGFGSGWFQINCEIVIHI